MRFVLQGAEVVDGTGSPRRRADVSVVGGHIEEVADTIDPRGDLSLDLEGLVLAPGFIDPHTHFDAQVLWDRDLTPSSWHGVTTVVTGNCGFGIAPTRPEHRSTIMRTLENVEGMPLTALEAGLPWTFETFPQYLDAVEAAPNRLNVACLAGHTPLRFYVLGEEATERNASADELATMRQLLRDALDAGAVGFSTSRSESHRGAYGRPVPSRAAALDEIRVLASVLGECGHGTLEATWGPDLFVDEFAALAREIGRPVTWAALMTLKADPEYSLRITREIEQAGGQCSHRSPARRLWCSSPWPSRRHCPTCRPSARSSPCPARREQPSMPTRSGESGRAPRSGSAGATSSTTPRCKRPNGTATCVTGPPSDSWPARGEPTPST